jgi:hypothetical protein
MKPLGSKLTEISLGREGIAYIGSCLRQGTGLCAKVAEISFRNGTTFAALPEGTSLERARDFKTGGLVTRRQTEAWLADYVQSACVGAGFGSLVFQDIWAKQSDVRIAHPSAFFDQTNVYYLLEKQAISISSVTEIFRQMKSFLSVAMYSEYLPRIEISSNGRFADEATILNLARKTVRVFSGAYDEEGFVVWSKQA